MNQQQVREILVERYCELKAKNKAISLRAFAQKLAISSGALSEIMRGERNISQKLALKICDKLLLSPAERNKVFPTAEGATNSPNFSYAQLSSDQFHAISDWQHFAVLSLMKTKNFKNDPQWVSRRLGITPSCAQETIHRLVRMGLVKENRGKLERTHARIESSDGILDLSVQRAHFRSLELAEKALEKTPIDKRDYTSITMAIDPKQLPKAKKIVRRFQDEISQLLESEQPEEVYQLCIQLFPLTTESL